MDRYNKVINESNVPVDIDFIKKEIEKISEKVAELRTAEIYTKILTRT